VYRKNEKTPMEPQILEKPRKARKARKPRKKPQAAVKATAVKATARATSGGSSSASAKTSNWKPKPVRKLVQRPEWYWLFTSEEWEALPPVDREQVKKIIVGFTPWGDAYDLTKLFPLDWWSEHTSTRLKLLFSIGGLSEVDRAETKDGQQVYFLQFDRECQKVRIFPVDTMISTIVPRDFLVL